MSRKLDAVAAYGLFSLLTIFFGLLVWRFPVAYIWATYEDLPGEWSQFYFFAITLYFSARLALTKSRFRLFFAVLALASFYVTGEEISWGQRLFNVAPPDFFIDHNLQQETNLHNFFIGPYNTLLKRVIEVGLALAFLVFGVVYPHELKVRSKLAVWLNAKGIPAPPAYLWPFFAAAALCEQRFFSFNEAEVAEIFLALALAIMAGHYWLAHQHQRQGAPAPQGGRQAAATALIFFAGLCLSAGTVALSATVPRLKAGMDETILNGMEQFASRYARCGSWENAASLYQLILGKKPKSVAVRRELAGCYQQQGKTEQFQDVNRQAIALDMTRYGRYPADVAVNLSLHKSFLQAGDSERARFHLQKALQAGELNARLDPESASAAYWLGKSYLAAGDPAAALRELQKAVELKPHSIPYKNALYRLTLDQQMGGAEADAAERGTGG